MMQPRLVKVSAYLLNVSFARASMRFTSFISVLVLRPSTFDTLSRTSNSTVQDLFLYSAQQGGSAEGGESVSSKGNELGIGLHQWLPANVVVGL